MKRKFLLGITFLFFVMGAYKAWEEKYEKFASAEIESDKDLQQTHDYWSVINSDRQQMQTQQTIIDNYLLESDPSARAVKKRTKILSDQISKFIVDEQSGSERAKSFVIELNPLMGIMMEHTDPSNRKDVLAFSEIAVAQREREINFYWFQAYQQFEIEYGEKLKSIRNQISDLGYETPKISYLVTNQIAEFTNNAEAQVAPPIVDAAKELQSLSIQIKEQP